VDEYLTEEERVAKLKSWWRENGWFLLGGAALGALALFGWNQYQAHMTRLSEGAAVVYQDVKRAVEEGNTDRASALLAELQADRPENAYTQQAALLVASKLVVSAPERAAEALRFVMEHTDDPELALIARSRLARVLAYREQYDEALALLAVDDPGQFAGRFNEVKGDIYAALGRVDEARAAYLAALVSGSGSGLVDTSFLQMKLADLSSGSAEGAAANAAPAEAAPAAPAEAAPAPPAAELPAGGEGA
jgi:predicted negative regulator of RcsB-dependent stress response